MKRRCTTRRCRALGTTSPECWDLYDTMMKARKRWENAEYNYYDRGRLPKGVRSNREMEERIAKIKARYDKLSAAFDAKGC